VYRGCPAASAIRAARRPQHPAPAHPNHHRVNNSRLATPQRPGSCAALTTPVSHSKLIKPPRLSVSLLKYLIVHSLSCTLLVVLSLLAAPGFQGNWSFAPQIQPIPIIRRLSVSVFPLQNVRLFSSQPSLGLPLKK
jgi:hypothetical protein